MGAFRKRHAGIARAITVALAVILQLAITIVVAVILQGQAPWFYMLIQIFSVLLVFMLVNDSKTYNNYWIVIILLLPVAGYFLYFMWGRRRKNSKEYVRYRQVVEKGLQYKKQEPEVIGEYRELHPNKAQIAQMLINSGFPLYKNTKVNYYTLGEKKFEAFFEDLKSAKKFIFLEYFIIYDGQIWRQIKEILAQKAQEGLEVRLLFDDFGCLIANTDEFRHELATMGVRVSIFSPIHEGASRFSFNYRNHQKIAVIDGKVAYTGGINLGDEYANIYEKHGHWKDTAIRLEGDGVWGLTSIFLEMWEFSKGYEDLDYSKYRCTQPQEVRGYVQPVADGPANNPRNPIEAMYTHMINKARDYIYFTTPYLVLDQKMIEDLCRAAQSGVDVRIITPRKYDKWFVYMVTVSNYGALLKSGVKIYEYVPGFIHSKTVVSDDECAVCGTINMDYRSFYLHYECGVFMSENEAVLDIRDDILETIHKCERITYDMWEKRPVGQKMIQWILKIFSPMM